MADLPNIPGFSRQTATTLAAFCAEHRVRNLRVFGSLVRGEASPDSDIDLLLEFEPGVDPDLFELGGMQQDLTDIFGREADLKTPEMFSPSNLRRILASSVLGYAA
jgi:predicted nucleotidyltransferase